MSATSGSICPKVSRLAESSARAAGANPRSSSEDGAHAGNQHSPADVRKELTTVTAIHGRSLLGLDKKHAGGHATPGSK